MDDFLDDFGNDYDGEFGDDFGHDDDDDSLDDTFDEISPEDDVSLESENDPCDGLHWADWMILGPLSEQIFKEKREQDRLVRQEAKRKKLRSGF